MFNNLLNKGSSVATNREMANDLMYLNRRVPRSELAAKVSAAACPNMIKNAVSKWFFDKEISAAVWGPTHYVVANTHYNRPWKRSSLGSYGSMASDVL